MTAQEFVDSFKTSPTTTPSPSQPITAGDFVKQFKAQAPVKPSGVVLASNGPAGIRSNGTPGVQPIAKAIAPIVTPVAAAEKTRVPNPPNIQELGNQITQLNQSIPFGWLKKEQLDAEINRPPTLRSPTPFELAEGKAYENSPEAKRTPTRQPQPWDNLLPPETKDKILKPFQQSYEAGKTLKSGHPIDALVQALSAVGQGLALPVTAPISYAVAGLQSQAQEPLKVPFGDWLVKIMPKADADVKLDDFHRSLAGLPKADRIDRLSRFGDSLQQGAREWLNAMGEPEMLALMAVGTGGLPESMQRVVGAGFGLQMAAGSYENSAEMLRELANGNFEAAAKHAPSALGDSLFAIQSAKHSFNSDSGPLSKKVIYEKGKTRNYVFAGDKLVDITGYKFVTKPDGRQGWEGSVEQKDGSGKPVLDKWKQPIFDERFYLHEGQEVVQRKFDDVRGSDIKKWIYDGLKRLEIPEGEIQKTIEAIEDFIVHEDRPERVEAYLKGLLMNRTTKWTPVKKDAPPAGNNKASSSPVIPNLLITSAPGADATKAGTEPTNDATQAPTTTTQPVTPVVGAGAEVKPAISPALEELLKKHSAALEGNEATPITGVFWIDANNWMHTGRLEAGHAALDPSLKGTTPQQREAKEFGFIDENGNSLTREAALEQAKKAGQVPQDFQGVLHSSDLTATPAVAPVPPQAPAASPKLATTQPAGPGADVLRAVGEARETQAKFLAERGMTMEQARALPPDQQQQLQAEYTEWLASQPPAPPVAQPTAAAKETGAVAKRAKVIADHAVVEQKALAANEATVDHRPAGEDEPENWLISSPAKGNDRTATVSLHKGQYIVEDENGSTIKWEKTPEDAIQEAKWHVEAGGNTEGDVANAEARNEIINTFDTPPDMKVEVEDTKWGSVYYKVTKILSRDADGEPDETKTYKLSIRDHEPSPFREKEFGAVDQWYEVPKNATPQQIADAVTKIEGWLRRHSDTANPPTPVPAPEKPVAPPTAAAKEPWQMTRAEWIEDTRRKLEPDNAKLRAQGYQGATPNESAHYNTVKNAIAAGKPVPPEVLADYPDIKPPGTVTPEADTAPVVATTLQDRFAASKGMTLAEMAKSPKKDQYAQEYRKWVEDLPIREQVAPKTLERLTAAIEAKDPNALKAILDIGNPLSRKIFTEETGIKLPSTQRDTRKAIDEWVAGPKPSAVSPAPTPEATTPAPVPPEAPAVTGGQVASNVTPQTLAEALHAGKTVKLPEGAKGVRVQVKGKFAKVEAKNIDTLKGAGPFDEVVAIDFPYKNGKPVLSESKIVKGDITTQTALPPAPPVTISFARHRELRDRADANLLAIKPTKDGNDYFVKRYPSRNSLETFLKNPGQWKAVIKKEVDKNMVVHPAFEVERADARKDEPAKPLTPQVKETPAAKPPVAMPTVGDLVTVNVDGRTINSRVKTSSPHGFSLSGGESFLADDVADGSVAWKPQAVAPAPATAQPSPVATSTPAVKSPLDNLNAEDRAEAERLEAELTKLLGQVLSGVPDPKIISTATQLAALYAKGGTKTFKQFAEAVKGRMPSLWERIKAYLRGAWNSIAEIMGLDEVDATTAKSIFEVIDKQGREADIKTGADNELLERPSGDTPAETVDAIRPTSEKTSQKQPARTSPRTVEKERPTAVPASATGASEGGLQPDGGTRNIPGGSAGDGDQGNDGERQSVTSGNTGGTGSGGLDSGVGSESVVEVANAGVKPAAKAPANSNNFSLTDLDIFENGGDKAKFKDNVAAIRLMKAIMEEQRLASPAEQATLARYVGWGRSSYSEGLFGYYGDEASKWAKEREELKALLTDDEWESARASTKNAHFTAPRLAVGMWDMVRRLGFKGGKINEPAEGIGLFYSVMPGDMRAKSSLVGSEMDNLTSNIAKLLHPDGHHETTPYQEANVPDDFFDLQISNYPFGDITIRQDKYNKIGANLHDYFFLKGISTVRPGGLLVAITSTGTLDKMNPRVREVLASKADLVAAMRLPSGSFLKNAGTSVVTDIVILKRRPEGVAPSGTKWMGIREVKMSGTAEPIPINEYYADHPEQILGMLDRKSKLYSGGQPNVSLTDDFVERLQQAIARLPENIYEKTTRTKPVTPSKIVEADSKLKDYGYEVRNSKELWQRQGNEMVQKKMGKEIAQVSKLLAIRDDIKKLTAQELAGVNDDHLTPLRETLNRHYDDYVKKFDNLHSKTHKRLIADDPDWVNLLALEQYNPENKTVTKADIFSKRTVKALEKKTKADSIKQAVGYSMNETGGIDPDRIGELIGKSHDEVVADLTRSGMAFKTPDGGLELSDFYLSGNVRAKLLQAEAAAKLDPSLNHNVEALKKAIPEDKPHSEIDVKLGSPWVLGSDYSEFFASLHNFRPEMMTAAYLQKTGKWILDVRDKYIKNRPSFTETYGTPMADFQDIVQSAMDDKPIMLYKPVKDADGEHRVFLPDESAAANLKVEEVRELFKEWVWTDDERRARLHRFYNDTMNNIVELKSDGSWLEFPTMSTSVIPYTHQNNTVSLIMHVRRVLMGHEVGTGKSLIYGMAAAKMKELGFANKPALSVLKANIEQVTEEIQRAFPTMKILSTNENFDAENRRKTIARIATGDWDLIILTHDNLNMMDVDKDVEEGFIREEIAELSDVIRAAEANSGERRYGRRAKKDKTTKQLEKLKERLEEKLKEALDRPRDTAITFQKSGIDMLMIDEAHVYKSLPVYTSRGSVKGIPQSRSDRATNLLLNTRWMRKNNPKAIMVFGTGTPIDNSMVELYNWQKYLQPEELEARGISAFDGWANTFGQTVTQIEPTAAGEFKPTTRFKRFTNLQELSAIARQMLDTRFVEDMPNIKRPKKIEAVVKADMNKEQAAYMRELAQRAKDLKGKKVEKGGDNMLKICTDGRKAALHMGLITPNYTENPEGKVAKAIAAVLANYKADPTVTQMIFSDMGVNPTDWGFSLYKHIIDGLVKGGIPRNKIIDFTKLKEGDERLAAIANLHNGQALVGIGSTATMGTGVNAQKHLKYGHNIDAPMTPGRMRQRDGRSWRQKNRHSEIGISRYVTEGSLDSFVWSLINNKDAFIHQFLKYGAKVREIEETDSEEISPARVMAEATGNPDVLNAVEAQENIKKLEQKRRIFQTAQARVQSQIDYENRNITRVQAEVPRLNRDFESAKTVMAQEAKEIEVHGKTYTEQKEPLKKALETAVDSLLGVELDKTDYPIAHIGPFTVVARMQGGRHAGQNTVHGYLVRGENTYEMGLAADESGTKDALSIARSALGTIRSIASGLHVKRAEDQIAQSKFNIETLQKQTGKKFDQDTTLAEEKRKLAEIMSRLVKQSKEGGSNDTDVKISAAEKKLEDLTGPNRVNQIKEQSEKLDWPSETYLKTLQSEIDAIEKKQHQSDESPDTESQSPEDAENSLKKRLSDDKGSIINPALLTKEVANEVRTIVEDAWGNGKRTTKGVYQWFRDKIGAAWIKIRSLVDRAIAELKRVVRDESGEVGRGTNPEPGQKVVASNIEGEYREERERDSVTQNPSRLTSRRVAADTARDIAASSAGNYRKWAAASGQSGDQLGAPDFARRFNEVLGLKPITSADLGISDTKNYSSWSLWERLHSDKMRRVNVGQGAEGAVFQSNNDQFAYKLYIPYNRGIGATLGIVELRGEVAAKAKPGSVLDLLDRIRIHNAIGGAPTEILGMTPEGVIVTKQPWGAERSEDVSGAIQRGAIVEVSDKAIARPTDTVRNFVTVVDGEPYLVSDVRGDNLRTDRSGNPRPIDMLVGKLDTEIVKDNPEISSAVAKADQIVSELPKARYDAVFSRNAVATKFSKIGEASATTRTPLSRDTFNEALASETMAVPFAAENVTAGLSTDTGADAEFWRMLAEQGGGQAAEEWQTPEPDEEYEERNQRIRRWDVGRDADGKSVDVQERWPLSDEVDENGNGLVDQTESPDIRVWNDGETYRDFKTLREAFDYANDQVKSGDMALEAKAEAEEQKENVRKTLRDSRWSIEGSDVFSHATVRGKGSYQSESMYLTVYLHPKSYEAAVKAHRLWPDATELYANNAAEFADDPESNYVRVDVRISDHPATDSAKSVPDVDLRIGDKRNPKQRRDRGGFGRPDSPTAWYESWGEVLENQGYNSPLDMALQFLGEKKSVAKLDNPRFHLSRNGEVRAITYGNRSHFFLDRYDNAGQLRGDIREEAGHRLVNEMGGRDWNIIGSLTYGGNWNNIAGEIEKNYGYKRGTPEFNHEVVAKAFRDGKHKVGLWRRFMDAVMLAFKRLARKLNFSLDLSDSEIRAYLNDLLSAKAKGRNPGERVEPSGETVTTTAARAQEQADTFYSALTKTVEDLPQEKFSPQQLKGMLAGKPGVKADELKWTGFNTWIDQRSADGKPVTKAEALEFLRENQVNVKVTDRGGEADSEVLDKVEKLVESFNKKFAGRYKATAEVAPEMTGDDVTIEVSFSGPSVFVGKKWQNDFPVPLMDADAKAAASEIYDTAHNPPGVTKFRSYMKNVPTDEGYGEAVFNLPAKQPFNTDNVKIERNRRSVTQGEYTIYYDGKKLATFADDIQMDKKGDYNGLPDSEIMETAKSIYNKGNPNSNIRAVGESFRVHSAHQYGDESDVNQVARVIYSTMTVPGIGKGKVGLEMQGDWAQKARESEKKLEPLTADEKAEYARLYAKAQERDLGTSENETFVELDRRVRQQETPDAPLIQKHYELSLKWLIRQAAEEGMDFVGWNAGSVVAERYDLSKEVDSVHYDPYNKQLSARKGDQQVIKEQGVPPEKLADYVGKDVAKKLLETPVNGAGNHELKGEQLRVGGGWASTLYDKMLVDYAKKYVKQWGGTVETANAPTNLNPQKDFGTFLKESGLQDQYESERASGKFYTQTSAYQKWYESNPDTVPLHIIKLTPSMKADVLTKGQPLFARSEAGALPPPTPPSKPTEPGGAEDEGEQPEKPFTGLRTRQNEQGQQIGQVYVKGELLHETPPTRLERTALGLARGFARNRRGKDPRFTDTVIKDIIRQETVPSSGETTKQIIKRTTDELSTAIGAAAFLNEKIAAMEEAAASGRAYGEAKKSSDIQQAFNYQRQITDFLKKSLIGYAEERLGRNLAGRYARALTDALKEPDPTKMLSEKEMAKSVYARYKKAASIVARIDSFADETSRREAYRSILKLARAAVQSENVSVEVKDRLRQFINSDHAAMSTEALQQMAEQTKQLVTLGRVTEEIRKQLFESQVQELVGLFGTEGETHPLNEHPLLRPQPGSELTWQDNLANRVISMRNLQTRFGWAYPPINYVLDLMSARNYGKGLVKWLKGPVDLGHQEYLKLSKKLYGDLAEKLQEWKIDSAASSRIAAYAEAMQAGGVENLFESGVDKSIIDQLWFNPDAFLKANEKKFYDYARERMDSQYDAVNNLTRRLYNREMPKVKNYWPRLRDWSQLSDMEVYDRLFEQRRKPSAKAPQGFTMKRTGGAMNVQLDATRVFQQHMDDVAYYLSMQEPVQVLMRAISSEKFREHYGATGQYAVRLWLDAVAKRGGGDNGQKRIKWVDWVSNRMNRAMTSYRPFSQMKHISNAGIAQALIGPSWYAAGVAHCCQTRWQDFMQRNVPELFIRGGGDMYKKQGMHPSEYLVARVTDKYNSMACFAGAYGKLMEEAGTPVPETGEIPLNKESLATALVYSHGATASVFTKDLPLMRSQGALSGNVTLDRAVTTFQGYLMERYGFYKRDFKALGIEERDAKQACRAAAGIIISSLIHLGVIALGVYITKEIAEALLAAAGIQQKVKKPRKNEPSPAVKAGEELLIDLVKNVAPMAGNAVSAWKYGSTGIPVVDAIEGAAQSVKRYAQAQTPNTKAQAGLALAGSAATFAGVPGSGQAQTLLRQLLPSGKPQSERQSLIEMYRANDPKAVNALNAAYSAGKITEADVRAIEKQAALSSLEAKLQHVHPKEAVDYFEKLTSAEQSEIRGMIEEKISYSRSLTDDQKNELLSRIEKTSKTRSASSMSDMIQTISQ